MIGGYLFIGGESDGTILNVSSEPRQIQITHKEQEDIYSTLPPSSSKLNYDSYNKIDILYQSKIKMSIFTCLSTEETLNRLNHFQYRTVLNQAASLYVDEVDKI